MSERKTTPRLKINWTVVVIIVVVCFWAVWAAANLLVDVNRWLQR